MKTILVPTDFTYTANLASNYAAKLAEKTGAELYLMNTIQLPSHLDTTAYRNFEVLEDIVKNADFQFAELRARYQKLGININTILKPSSQPEELKNHLCLIDPDLIIMGTTRFKMVNEFSKISNVPIIMLKNDITLAKDKGLFVCLGNKIINKDMLDEISGIVKFFGSRVTFCQKNEFSDIYKESLINTLSDAHIDFTLLDENVRLSPEYLNNNYNAFLFRIDINASQKGGNSRLYNELLPSLSIPAFIYPTINKKELFFTSLPHLAGKVPSYDLL